MILAMDIKCSLKIDSMAVAASNNGTSIGSGKLYLTNKKISPPTSMWLRRRRAVYCEGGHSA